MKTVHVVLVTTSAARWNENNHIISPCEVCMVYPQLPIVANP